MTKRKRRWWEEILNHARRVQRRRSARERFVCPLGPIEQLENRWVLSGVSLIAINDPSITEGDSGAANLNFTVSRTGETSTNVTVSFNTSDLSPAAGAATAGVDYTATSGTVTIPSGSTTTTISVPVLGDTLVEGNETFFVNLTGISNVTGRATGFAAKQDFSTSSGSFSVSVGDMNGDGKPDLAVANVNTDTVSVFLNTTAPGAATPSFAAKQDFATGSRPFSVSLGDMNGDGRLDLAVANGSSNTVSVLLNMTLPGATTPSFAAKQDFTTSLRPRSVSVGDLNGDGKPDLAVGNGGSNTVAVLLNTTAPGAAHDIVNQKTEKRIYLQVDTICIQMPALVQSSYALRGIAIEYYGGASATFKSPQGVSRRNTNQ